MNVKKHILSEWIGNQCIANGWLFNIKAVGFTYIDVRFSPVSEMEPVNTTVAIDNIDLFLKEDGQAVTNLGLMAAKIAFYNFQWRYTALIVFLSTPSSRALDTFLWNYNNSVSLKLGKFQPLHRSHIPQYVIFAEETSKITEYLSWLMEMQYDNTGKFLLICYSMDEQRCNENMIFKVLANIYINNAIFLRIGEDNKPVPFTYQVILPGVCKNYKPERLNITNDCLNDLCFELVYREHLKNLQKCPLIVSTFEQPPFMYLHNGTGEPTGGDADMLKIVTSVLNATLVIKTPQDGEDWGHFKNNNWTGSMGDVFNDRAHLSVCSMPLTSFKYGNFQVSWIYNTMDIVWVAKLPALTPSWEKLLYPFKYRARLSVFIVFIFIIIFAVFIRSPTWRTAGKSFNIGDTKQSILFYSWVIFLGMPIIKIPAKRVLIIIVFTWIWFSFVIRNSYQAALIHSLKNSVYEQNFESFNNVLKKKLSYGGQLTYREYFVDEKYIYDNWEILDQKAAHDMLHRISNGTTSFVLAANKEIVIEHLLKHSGKRRLQMIPLKIINSPTVMYLRKYSPLSQRLNIVLSRAVESGYAQAWHMRFARQKKVLFEHSNKQTSNPLNLEHFGGCFLLTMIGWVVSIIFFVIEVYCGTMEEYYD